MDLGHFDNTLLLFGGPYSNLDALLALKQQAESLSIPPENIICTGDIVAYCGQPYETVEAIREWGIHVLMGNCEESFATDAEDCGCGFTEGSSCDLLSVQWFQFANKQLKADQRMWFSQLPRHIMFTINNKKCLVVHGSVTSINQFIYHSHNTEIFHEQFQKTDADIIIGGHCGIPFTKKIDNKLWHNAGAIGMPANDGEAHTWYSLLTLEKNHTEKSDIKSSSLSIETCKLVYNHQQASNKMADSELNNGYQKALTSGLWPSMDVLPTREKQQQGIPINAEKITF
jgi:predicted phosphodiesterase